MMHGRLEREMTTGEPPPAPSRDFIRDIFRPTSVRKAQAG